MKDLRVALSPVKGSGNFICTVGMFAAGIIVMGAGTGIGAGACLKVLIFGAGCLGCVRGPPSGPTLCLPAYA